MRMLLVFGPVAFAAGLLLTCGGAYAASAEKGKTAYTQHGCWQCHGMQAQGGLTGPKLAPDPIPIEAFTAFVRTTNRAMPPYSEAILPNDGSPLAYEQGSPVTVHLPPVRPGYRYQQGQDGIISEVPVNSK